MCTRLYTWKILTNKCMVFHFCQQLSGPDIFPRHCVFAHTEGIVTVVPTARDAEVYVDNRRVKDTTMLRHGMTVQFGRHHFFKFLDPRFEEVCACLCLCCFDINRKNVYE